MNKREPLEKEVSINNFLDTVGSWLDERCPKCNSYLLGNKLGDKWCSLVGCNYDNNKDK